MVRIDIDYRGRLRCGARHAPSGETLTTDAPVDNQGRGETFSPTDLVATALGTCVATIMGIYAERNGIALEGMRAVVEKEMTSEAPRRIARLSLAFRMPPGLSAGARTSLEAFVDACPVRRSLHPSIEVPIRFEYPD